MHKVWAVGWAGSLCSLSEGKGKCWASEALSLLPKLSAEWPAKPAKEAQVARHTDFLHVLGSKSCAGQWLHVFEKLSTCLCVLMKDEGVFFGQFYPALFWNHLYPCVVNTKTKFICKPLKCEPIKKFLMCIDTEGLPRKEELLLCKSLL